MILTNFRYLALILFFVFCSDNILPQKFNHDHFANLVTSLVSNNADLSKFTNTQSVELSNRLGIKYNGNINKFLISYEIDENIIRDIQSKKLTYYYSIDEIDSVFKILTITVDQLNYSKTYFLKNDSLFPPVLYHTQDWSVIESDHFKFIVSDNSLINDYSIKKLEESYKIISTLFGFTISEEEIIKSNKILYVLCRNENEVELLTGYTARGIYNLAYDAIITSYNSHYHELVHLLINYKLKHSHLYTHPFLMEGIATALGGRGGIHQRVLLETGAFLFISGFGELEEIASTIDFRNTDASISYALSGIYCYYLLHQVGIDSFLATYQSYSGNANEIMGMSIDLNKLPSVDGMINFIEEHFPKQILFDINKNDAMLFYSDGFNSIYENVIYYHFQISTPLFLKSGFSFQNYKSNKIQELKLEEKYNEEQYLIIVSESEISVYDLYLNTLIHSYVQGFNFDFRSVPKNGDQFSFSIPKSYLKLVL